MKTPNANTSPQAKKGSLLPEPDSADAGTQPTRVLSHAETGLAPCPFCGSKNVSVEPLVGGFVVDCKDCGGGCGTCHDEQAATDEWNKRAVPIFNAQFHFTYADLFEAFVKGAKEAVANPKVTATQIRQSADAYTKLIHQERDPAMFAALSVPSDNTEEMK